MIDDHNEFARAHGLPTLQYQIYNANDEHVCDECLAVSKIVTAEKPETPVPACQSEGGCRCMVVKTDRPVGPIKPVPVTSGKHRKHKEIRCKLEAESPSPIERILGKRRKAKDDD